MKTLIVLPTYNEAAPLLKHLELEQGEFRRITDETGVLIGGIGMLSTAVHLCAFCSQQMPKRIIMAGVAGYFSEALSPGDVVEVVSQQYGDLGTTDNNTFLDLNAMGLTYPTEIPNGRLTNTPQFNMLKPVSGISVNTVTGTMSTAEMLKKHFSVDVECMEGIALFWMCQKNNIPFSEIRAISNRVGQRNKTQWALEKAIANLTHFLMNHVVE